MKKKYILVFIVFLFAIDYVYALKTIPLNDSSTSFAASSEYVEIFEDSSNSLSLNDILSIPANQRSSYTKLANRNPEFTYWVRFKINTDLHTKNKWILEILDSKFKSVTLYAPDQNGKYHSKNEGVDFPFNSREYDHKNFVFDLDLPLSANQYYYLRFKPDRRGSLMFKISSNQRFAGYSLKEYYLLGFYYGILFIIAIYNIILFFTLREKIYLFYVLYVIAWTWNSLIEDGIGFQYIWSSFPIISKIGSYSSKSLLLILFVVYSGLFLNIKSYSSLLNKIIKWVVGIYFLVDVVALVFSLNFAISASFYLIPFFLIYYTSVKIYLRGYLPARLFIISNTMIVLGLLIRLIKITGILKYITSSEAFSVIGVYGFNIGILAEIVLFSVALGDRIRFLKIAEQEAQKKTIDQLVINEKLSNKVNRELEEKVAERTRELNLKAEELNEANLKLSQQAEEISRWNQMLDLDNHKLKTQVKEAVEARIKFRDISYDDFLTIFPDDMACKRYIEEIKWGNGYLCKKCGNQKFCAGNKPFSRRCTKCRYDESITAYTILHKCKFSLVKAFYIIAKVNKYEEDLNSNELSRQLEMRPTTVWELKKKIMEVKKLSKASSDEGASLDYLLLNSLR
ncbi:MAG: 7TM diverse intracellular signaling domain-containing protein [Cytophagaceae bacterium]